MTTYSNKAVSCLLTGFPILSSRTNVYWDYSSMIGELIQKPICYPTTSEKQQAKKIFLEKFPEIQKLLPKKITPESSIEAYMQIREKYPDQFIFS